jgi:hypothetical protein
MKKSNKPIDVAGERGQELAMLQGKKNQLNALLQITRSLSSELNLAKLLQRITTEVK